MMILAGREAFSSDGVAVGYVERAFPEGGRQNGPGKNLASLRPAGLLELLS